MSISKAAKIANAFVEDGLRPATAKELARKSPIPRLLALDETSLRAVLRGAPSQQGRLGSLRGDGKHQLCPAIGHAA